MKKAPAFLAALLSFCIVLSVQAAPKNTYCDDQLISKKKPREVALLNVVQSLSRAVSMRLGANSDPFIAAGAFDYESATRLMESLSYEKMSNSDNKQLSVLGDVRKYIHSTPATATTYTPELKLVIDRIYRFTRGVIQDKSATKANLYRAHLAIQLIQPFIYRLQPAQSVDRDGIPTDEQKEKDEGKEKKEDEKPKEKEPPEPDILELPEEYDPFTKETESDGEPESKGKFAHIQFAGTTPYFKSTNFNLVTRNGDNRFRSADIPMFDTTLARNLGNTKKARVEIGPKQIGKEVNLACPAGYVPVENQDAGYTLRRVSNGNFRITMSKLVVEVPFAPEVLDLNPLQREYMTSPLGIGENEWPERMRLELFPLLKNKGPVEAAKLVEAFIRNRYLYSVNAKEEKDPIAALKSGAFQCDMAAMIMVGILRDHLKIPARAIGGVRAKKGVNNSSTLFVPGEGHAWVEIFHDGKVITLDPTPKTKDKKTDSKGEPAPSDQQKEFDDDTFENEFPDIEEDGVPTDEPSDAKDSKPPKESKDSKDGKDKKDQKKTETQDGAGKDKKEDKEAAGLTPEEKAQIQDELARDLALGSLSLKDENGANKFIDRAVRVILRDMFAPQFDTRRARKYLAFLQADPRLQNKKYKQVFAQAEQALIYRQTGLPDALLGLTGELLKNPLNSSYRKLLQMIDRLTFFAEMLDPETRPKEIVKALQLLLRAQSEFLKLTKPDAHEIAVVRKFMDNLPPHSRRIFADTFKIKNIESDGGTKTAYGALMNGSQKDLNLIRLLYPLTNFILDSVPTPSYKEIRTQEENSRSRANPTYTQLHSLQRSQYAISGQPEKDAYENMIDGTLYLKTRQRRVKVPRAGGQTDPYRVTIALYDTSGSMDGDPGDFQAAILAAFVDRALSEVGPSGEHRHIAQLMGFDERVHSTYAIRNSEEAREVILHHRKKLANTGQGTNIEEALKQAFAAIEDAQKQAGEPLASANIILMTDGEATVDLDKVRKWRAAIDRRTPVKIMLVSINGSNPKLMELVNDIKAAGVEESYYVEYGSSAIKEFIDESRQVPKVDMKRDFHTVARPQDLSPLVQRYLEEASSLVRVGVANYENRIRSTGHQKWRQKLQQVAYQPDRDRKDFLVPLLSFREFIDRSKVFRDARLNVITLDEIMRRLHTISGRELQTLDVKEIQSLTWMIEQLEQALKGQP